MTKSSKNVSGITSSFSCSDSFSPSKVGNTQDIKETSFKIKTIKDSVNMDSWKIFQLPEPLLKALEELCFSQPTQIQSLTLPAAVLGKYLAYLFRL